MSPTAVVDPVFEALGMQPVENFGAGQSPLSPTSPAAQTASPFGAVPQQSAMLPPEAFWSPPAWSLYAQAAAAAAAAASAGCQPLSPSGLSACATSPMSATQWPGSPPASTAGAVSPGGPGSPGVNGGCAGPLLLPDVLPAAGEAPAAPPAEVPLVPKPVGEVIKTQAPAASGQTQSPPTAGTGATPEDSEGAAKATPQLPGPLGPQAAAPQAGVPNPWNGAAPPGGAPLPPGGAQSPQWMAAWFAQMGAMMALQQQQQQQQQAFAAAAAAMAMQNPQPLMPLQPVQPVNATTFDSPVKGPLATTPTSAPPHSPSKGENKENQEKIELNLAERTADFSPSPGKAPKKEKGTPVSLMLATPPPAKGMRAEAQAFVPGAIATPSDMGLAMTPSPPMPPVMPGLQMTSFSNSYPLGDATPVKACLMQSLELEDVDEKPVGEEAVPEQFVEMRTEMLRHRHGMGKGGRAASPTPKLKFGTEPRPTPPRDESEDVEEELAAVPAAPAPWTKDEGISAGSMLLQLVKGEGSKAEASRGKGGRSSAPAAAEKSGAAKGEQVLQLLKGKGEGKVKGEGKGTRGDRSRLRAEIRASAAAARKGVEEQTSADDVSESAPEPAAEAPAPRRRRRGGVGRS